tara:strand:- start:13822 stop:14766 length:945 start_codon:yes stop_codon:yes gene_type:complete
MCSKGGLTAGQSAWAGFGLDAFGALGGYFQQRRDTRRQNEAIARQNRLLINAYDTKNRNAENAWNNDKLDLDIAVENKYRETIDAISEAQAKARETMGQSAIAQQQILTKMINASAGREQTGRRTGRKNFAELGAQWAAQGASASFARDSAILFQDRAGKSMSAFAGGKYVEYITGRPSPAAPPLLQAFKKGPSFLNTALSIAGSALSRYNQYKKATDKPGWGNALKSGKTGAENIPWQQDPNQGGPSLSESFTYGKDHGFDMDVPRYESPVNMFGGSGVQAEMDDWFDSKRNFSSENELGIDWQNSFGIGGDK